MPRIISAVFALAAGLAGCSGSAPPPAPKPAMPQKTMIDVQLQDLQKARDIQKVLDESAKRTDQAIDQQSGGP